MELDLAGPLAIDVAHDAGTTTVALGGDLDIATATRLGNVVRGVIAAGHEQVTLDLHALEFCDSTGLRAIVELHQQLEALGGHLELHEPQAAMRKVLELTAMDRLLHVSA